MANPDEIRGVLGDVGASIEPGDMETARVGVHDTLRRRRRRSRVVAALGAGVLVVGGIVAFASFDNSDDPATLVGVDPTTTVASDPTTTVADEESAPAEASAPMPSATTQEEPSAALGTAVLLDRQGTAVTSPDLGSDEGYGVQWAVPWKDGFLVGATIYAPQPLPSEQLPDEIVALFPDEVNDLFPDGLPPTVNEATAILSEAGLLNVVMEILESNEEANEAIMGTPTPPPTIEVRFTVDGSTWEPVEMVLPDGVSDMQSVVSAGDRLAVLSVPPLNATPDAGGAVVATTTDLTTWTIQSIEMPPPAIDLPDYVDRFVGAVGIVANEFGWVVSLHESFEPNFEALLTEELGAVGGYGVSDEGIEVFSEQIGDGGAPEEVVTYSWEELGVSPDIVEYLFRRGEGGGQQLWAATWDGVPARSDRNPTHGWPLLATDSGFLAWGDQTWFSADGLSWSASPLPIPDGYVGGGTSFDGGAIIIGNHGSGGDDAVYRVDASGQSAELVEIPGLPPSLQWAGPDLGGSALLFDSAVHPADTTPVVVQAEGFELIVSMGAGIYELRDAASGEVVISDGALDGDRDEYLTYGDDGWAFSNPDTGEDLVFFPSDVVNSALDGHYGSFSSVSYEPDFWFLATPDGERFIVDDIENGFEYGPVTAVVNGDTMLVFSGSDWTLYNFS